MMSHYTKTPATLLMTPNAAMRQTRVLLAVVIALGALSCGDDTGSGELAATCATGVTASCFCPGGQPGQQTCQASGAFSSCTCAQADAAGPDGETNSDVDDDIDGNDAAGVDGEDPSADAEAVRFILTEEDLDLELKGIFDEAVRLGAADLLRAVVNEESQFEFEAAEGCDRRIGSVGGAPVADFSFRLNHDPCDVGLSTISGGPIRFSGIAAQSVAPTRSRSRGDLVGSLSVLWDPQIDSDNFGEECRINGDWDVQFNTQEVSDLALSGLVEATIACGNAIRSCSFIGGGETSCERPSGLQGTFED